MGKYLDFIEKASKPKTRVFEVRSKTNAVLLGTVKWYGQWRRYCFFIDSSGLVFDAGCLADIQEFINGLMAERKKNA
jgi:hypothetical protein